MKDPALLIAYLEQFPYVGILISLLFSGYVIFVPEEIVLLAVGYLASTGVVRPLLATLVALIATLMGDCILFSLARKGNVHIRNIKEKLERTSFGKTKFLSFKEIGKTIFTFRFIIGLRFLGPVLAGSHKVRPATFLFFDALALIIYVPALILLGFYLHNSFLRIVTRIEALRHLIFLAILLALGVGIIVFVRKKIFKKNEVLG